MTEQMSPAASPPAAAIALGRSASMSLMPLREMYAISTRSHAAWGVDGYEAPKQYFDHAKVIQDRVYEEIAKSGKAVKNGKHITKRGSYLDEDYLYQKNKPGPQKYDVSHKWVTEAEIEKGKKMPKDTQRNTFIDEIFTEQKRRGIPGPGKYNIIKTDEQVKAEAEKMNKKIKYGDKQNSLNDYEYLSNTIPGPGNYNPRSILPKIHKDAMSPDKWINLHKELAKKSGKSKSPDMGTYKMNYPLDYDTFGKMLAKAKEDGAKKSSVKHLGTEERFKDMKKSKSKSILNVPGPGMYPMVPQWPGKDKPKEGKAKNWMDSISTGIQKSIYQ